MIAPIFHDIFPLRLLTWSRSHFPITVFFLCPFQLRRAVCQLHRLTAAASVATSADGEGTELIQNILQQYRKKLLFPFSSSGLPPGTPAAADDFGPRHPDRVPGSNAGGVRRQEQEEDHEAAQLDWRRRSRR